MLEGVLSLIVFHFEFFIADNFAIIIAFSFLFLPSSLFIFALRVDFYTVETVVGAHEVFVPTAKTYALPT